MSLSGLFMINDCLSCFVTFFFWLWFPLSASNVEKTLDSSDEEGNPFAVDANGNGNPFEDEPASPVISVPVKALYDYEGQEQDELSFKAGKIVPEKLGQRIKHARRILENLVCL